MQTFVTAWPPVPRRVRQGVYRIHDGSLFIYFVYISFLRFYLNKILGIKKERSPRNCRLAVALSHDR